VDNHALSRDRSAAAAVISIVLAAVSAFFFFSHIVLFLFPIMPVGAWLGWEGRDSRFQVLGWIGLVVCTALALLLAVTGISYLLD
jgi:hypothetical protein